MFLLNFICCSNLLPSSLYYDEVKSIVKQRICDSKLEKSILESCVKSKSKEVDFTYLIIIIFSIFIIKILIK
ncbi:hypothetical protein A0H76_2528 [Hepatospora eriocheir]|uniref:Uncharacterized protein n=1 Tax=Hepatospora eriocheir TaxID=1081669 RepID=A0A1X0QJR3_9MICR|nr:hypothetical protein A0H76_2528 [Hepatospora eriocheir]